MIPIPRTPHQLTPNVKLLQKITLEHQGKALIVRRDANSFSRPNCWDLPGGNSEWPSDITEPTSNLHQRDASREVFEETGIHVDPEGFTQENLKYLETFFDPEKQVFTVLLGWLIQLPEDFNPNSVQLSEEHVEYLWVDPVSAGEFDFGGKRGEFLSRILRSTQQ